jgi:hypothetical protein
MFKSCSIDRERDSTVEEMSEQEDHQQQQQEKMTTNPMTTIMLKVIGCRATEEEFQKLILPIMDDCYQLGLIDQQTVTAFVKFCINFWIAHYTTKKQHFEMSQQQIDQGREKLARIAAAAEKEAYENNSTARVIEKATHELERLGKELDKGFFDDEEATTQQHPSSSMAAAMTQQQQQQTAETTWIDFPIFRQR